MTRLSRPTLRALRSVVARALGVRRSRVRVIDRREEDDAHRELMVRTSGDGRDWWTVTYHAQPCGRRWAVRYVTRRARANDLP